MDIIELTRQLGKMIQNEEAYLKYQIAKQAADEDEELQELIGEFNLKRLSISNETSKEENERDREKLIKLNNEMRSAYAKAMSNERMIAYNDAKGEFDMLINRIEAIIRKSCIGEDPETADYTPSCSGSCAECGGCG